jgi:hypothetical protein
MAKRRAVLERIAGVSGLGVAVGLAGCGSSGGAGGTNESTGGGTSGADAGSGSNADDAAGENGTGGATNASGSGGGSASASGPTVKGVVKGKRLVGDEGEPFARMNATAVTVSDDAYEGRFSRGNFTVGDGLAEEMGSAYGDVRYHVVIRLTTEDPSADADVDDRVAYVTSRESFNAVGLGETVWFRTGTGGGDEPRITEFIAE